MGDLKWMRQNGLEAAVKKLPKVFGVWNLWWLSNVRSGDFRPDGVEEGGKIRGWNCFPCQLF